MPGVASIRAARLRGLDRMAAEMTDSHLRAAVANAGGTTDSRLMSGSAHISAVSGMPVPDVSMKLSIVIPVYNERSFIEEVLMRVQRVPLRKEIIVVDDGSSDGTRELLRECAEAQASGQRERLTQDGRTLFLDDMVFLFQEHNQGKGAAVRRGFEMVSGDIVLVQDADLEYDPRDYDRLLAPILDGHADVVFGSRFLGGPQRVHYFWHYAGNRLLTLLSDMLTNLKLTDMETCYKVFRREVLKGIRLKSNRFGFEPEITAKIAKGNWRVYEVPISYAGRTYAEGKKITWKDGAIALWYIVRYNLFN
jgi:glycosyltransferase involved in cell wall biosynthesis